MGSWFLCVWLLGGCVCARVWVPQFKEKKRLCDCRKWKLERGALEIQKAKLNRWFSDWEVYAISDRDLFRLCPPQYVICPRVRKHVPLHSKSLCKNMARASGGANKMGLLSWGGGGGGGGGGTNGIDPLIDSILRSQSIIPPATKYW